MGDNRPQSQDSRAFGPITEDLILGRAWLRYFPLERVGVIDRPSYPALDDTDTAGALMGGAATRGRARGRRTLIRSPLSGRQARAGSSATIQASISRP